MKKIIEEMQEVIGEVVAAEEEILITSNTSVMIMKVMVRVKVKLVVEGEEVVEVAVEEEVEEEATMVATTKVEMVWNIGQEIEAEEVTTGEEVDMKLMTIISSKMTFMGMQVLQELELENSVFRPMLVNLMFRCHSRPMLLCTIGPILQTNEMDLWSVISSAFVCGNS